MNLSLILRQGRGCPTSGRDTLYIFWNVPHQGKGHSESRQGLFRSTSRNLSYRYPGQISPNIPCPIMPVRGKSIGGLLLQEAHKRVALLGYESAVLLGHKDYYPRFGYRRVKDFGIEFPFDALDECCMAIESRLRSLASFNRKVHYPYLFFE